MDAVSRSASALNFVSSPTGDHEHRHVERTEARPQRLLRAGAREPEAGRESFDRVAAARSSPELRRVGEAGEQRLRQPPSRNDSSPSRSRRSASAASARRRSARAVGIVDAARAADEHETADDLRLRRARDAARSERPSSSRDTVASPPRSAMSARAGTEVGVDGGRLAVAGCVDAHDLVVEREIGGDGSPAVAVLGEPVHEHEPRTRDRRRPRDST